MQDTKRLLVPLDGSALADRALTQVRRLLIGHDHEVVLLGVVAPGGDDLDERREAARQHLFRAREALVEQGATVTVEVAKGQPAAEIVACAARLRPELVVMSSHGRSGPSRFLRGSVAESVLRACPAPVLVVTPWALDAADEQGPLGFARLLVPLDGSPVSLEVLPVVELLARRYGSEVLLLHVDAPIHLLGEPGFVPPARAPEVVTAALRPVRDRLVAAGLRARLVAGYGPEALAIVETAEREQADLVVMSTHGRSGAARWLYGSVAEQVLRHCARPLLVRRVHAGQEADPPADPPRAARPPALSGRELIGARVQDVTHTDLGTIDDVVLDLAGRATYVVLRFGGLLGVGQKLFPVPWTALRARADGTFVLEHGRPREELRDAPHLPRERAGPHDWVHDRSLVAAVHSFYPGPRA